MRCLKEEQMEQLITDVKKIGYKIESVRPHGVILQGHDKKQYALGIVTSVKFNRDGYSMRFAK